METQIKQILSRAIKSRHLLDKRLNMFIDKYITGDYAIDITHSHGYPRQFVFLYKDEPIISWWNEPPFAKVAIGECKDTKLIEFGLSILDEISTKKVN